MSSYSRTLGKISDVLCSMDSPRADCHYSHTKDGWMVCIGDKNAKELNQVFIEHEIKGYKIIKSADMVIQVMHKLGVYEINFNLPA